MGVETATGLPASASVTLVASADAPWTRGSIVRGQLGNETVPFQGWYSSTYNGIGNLTAPTAVYDGEVPAGVSTFGWLFVPSTSATPVSGVALSLTPVTPAGEVRAVVTIGGKSEVTTLEMGPPPPPPPPCPAGTRRLCPGADGCVKLDLECPAGETVDVVLVSGDDGSCDCAEYCATDWEGAVHKERPQWMGATSAASAHKPFRCGGATVCACTQATHFCPKIEHECQEGCQAPGKPRARQWCRSQGAKVVKETL